MPTQLKIFDGSAVQAVSVYGAALIGAAIITDPVGPWPGGVCDVTQIDPDPNAPEIVMLVRHRATGAEIGVFYDDRVTLSETLPDWWERPA